MDMARLDRIFRMKKITLTDAEVVTAQLVAQMRQLCARAASVRDAKKGPQSGYDTDLEGVGAEFAFCKAFNYWPDLTVGPKSGGWDVKTRSGQTVDVKVTRYADGRLLATTKKTKSDSDLYVLMVGKFPTYELKGYTTADELLREENLADLGHGPTYAMEQGDLRQI